MGTAATTTTTLSTAMKTYYEETFLSHFKEVLVLQNMGQAVPLPLHSGKTVDWFRYHPFAKVTSAGTEGDTGTYTYKGFTGFNVQGTVALWHDQFEFSELLYLTSRDPFLARSTELIGQQAGESIERETLRILAQKNIWPIDVRQVNSTSGADKTSYFTEGAIVSSVESTSAAASYIIHIRAKSSAGGMTISNVTLSDDVLNGGWVCVSKGAGYGYCSRITDYVSDNQELTLDDAPPEVLQSNGNTNGTYLTICNPFRWLMSSGDVITTKQLQKAEEVLYKNGAPTFEDGLYRAYVQPVIYRQLLSDTTWVTSVQYDQKSEGLRNNDLGVWSRTRFMRGTTGARYANTGQTNNSFSETAGNIYLTLVMGRDAFGVIALEGRGMPEMNMYTEGNTENVNKLYGRAGWKLYWKVQPLNANFSVGIFSYA